MVQLSSVNFISLVILCIAPENAKSGYYIKNEDARGKFGKLLKTIVDANEQKLQSLKNLFALDDFKEASGYLRDTGGQKGPLIAVILKNKNKANYLQYKMYGKSRGAKNTEFRDVQWMQEQENDYETGDEVKLEELLQDIEYLIKEHEGEEKSLDIPQIKNLNHRTEIKNKPLVAEFNPKMVTKDILRWKSCARKAKKECKKACTAAYKDVCSTYKCSHSMKKSLKKNCKNECKEKFDH